MLSSYDTKTPLIKIINPIRKKGEYGLTIDIFCKISLTSNGNLSIYGYEWYRNRDFSDYDIYGQIYNSISDNIGYYNLGWDKKLLQQFIAVWKKWHLNHKRIGCIHQRHELKWNNIRLDNSKPKTKDNLAINYYKDHISKSKVRPQGLLLEPCPICGHEYGSNYFKEDLPKGIINFMLDLPEIKKEINGLDL